MIELSKRPLLDGEATAAGGGEFGVAQNFYGNLAAQVFPFRKIDHTHPAFADFPDNPVGTEPFERGSAREGITENLVGRLSEVAIQERIAGSVFFEKDENLAG
jgi:hypothetical protein